MNELAARARAVAAGEIAVGLAGEVLAARGVGSCVVVALYDPVARLGGLAHAMLPRRGNAGDEPLKYVDAAIERLLAELEAAGPIARGWWPAWRAAPRCSAWICPRRRRRWASATSRPPGAELVRRQCCWWAR